VAVGGGDAKGGGGAGVGAEEDGARGRVALRLGLADDGAERALQVYRRRRHLAPRPDGDEVAGEEEPRAPGQIVFLLFWA
jgi:hypothetical protein